MLKRILLLSLLAVLITTGYAYYSYREHSGTSLVSNLPWQINQQSDGSITVFTLTPGQSRMQQVIALNPNDHEVAIISDRDNRYGLEVYFPYFFAGPLKGKLVATIDVNPEKLQSMMASAVNASYMATGARKFALNEADYRFALDQPLQSLTFIPAANLDEAIVLQRFGQFKEKVAVNSGTTQYFYPELGLVITVNTEGKERLQYVHPQSFDTLLMAPGHSQSQPD